MKLLSQDFACGAFGQLRAELNKDGNLEVRYSPAAEFRDIFFIARPQRHYHGLYSLHSVGSRNPDHDGLFHFGMLFQKSFNLKGVDLVSGLVDEKCFPADGEEKAVRVDSP